MSDRYDLMMRDYEEEFYCTVGYVIDNETGWTDDFCPSSYVDKYITKLNEMNKTIKKLQKHIVKLEEKINELATE